MNTRNDISVGTSEAKAACSTSTDALVRQFQDKRQLYEAFTVRLRTLLEDLLEAADIRVHLIEGRTKEVASLAEKVCRPGKTYQQSIDEIPDLSGLRIIAYYIDDVDTIAELIKAEFDVDSESSIDKRQLLEENEFGYLSVHFVVRLHPNRAAQTEWCKFHGIKAEIQVRTVLQHSWAAISHLLQYKSKHDIPKALRRKLFRLCGIFELADEEFLALRRAHESLSSEIESKIAQDALDIEISPESLAHYVDHTGLDGRFVPTVESLGWDVIPFCHGNRMEDYSDLRTICEMTGIDSVRKFEMQFSALESKGDSYLRRLAEESRDPWTVSPLFILELLLLMHRGENLTDQQLVERLDWDPYSAEVVLSIAKSANETSDAREASTPA
jgi:ppGpp synthetase/RelA/SpoT-type nucleotidyltranferase